MSDAVENSIFDAEAKESLLDIPAEEGLLSESEAHTNRISARETFMRLILLIRSTELFKSGADYAADITSSPDGYASITSSDEILTTDEGSRIVAALEISADSTDEDILISAHSASDNYREHTIDLQENQRKNINKIVREKNLRDLRNFGGVRGVAEALNTDLRRGNSSPLDIRKCKPSRPSQILWIVVHSFLGACNNYTIFLLSGAAIFSLGFGIKEEGLHMGWFNGGVLVASILIIVIATTIRKSWEEWSRKKSKNSWQLKGKKIQVRVVRGGDIHFVSEIDLEVGDVAVLQKGDQVPADGLFMSADQALELDDGLIKSSTTIDENNPFLFYGSRVINGNARMLVTSTTTDTVWGEMMSQAMEASAGNECEFESYLHKLYTCVQKAGLLISILIMLVLILRYEVGKLDDERTFRPDSTGEPTPVRTILDAIKGIITESRGTARVLTTLLSVSLLGIMEGVPFAISVAAIIWSSKTLAHKASERDYLACVKMARITTIITDKFGGMAEYERGIDKFYVGEEFVSESSVLASEVLEALCDGIGTLSYILSSDCESELKPLLLWAEAKLGMKRDLVEQSKMTSLGGRNPFNELCQVVVEKKGNDRYLHLQGSPHHILSVCSHYYGIDGGIRDIDEEERRKLEQDIVRCVLAEEAKVIAYACKRIRDHDEVSVELNHLIFLAMISMKETKMEDTKRAVSTLKDAGIRTILASGDDIAVLETIGRNGGLLTDSSHDLVLPAERFRAWSDEERRDEVGKIRIMGNCLPSDKILLINCLRERGDVVALLAQRTVDAPALKEADVGITYGHFSSEVARECCDMSIWDGDYFSLLVNVVKNGRCFQENIRKFIQLELILAISSSLINFVAVVFWGDAPITAVQLFWLNLVVGLVGGLALLTGPSTTTLMTMQPVESSARLITKAMCRNIGIQVFYLTALFLTLQLKGQVILGTSGHRVESVIYNGFFLCQMFNKFIAREPEKKNIFSGLFHNNRWFWVASVLFLICQAVFAVAEVLLSNSPGLNFKLSGACLLIGLGCLLFDWAGKIVSDFIARWDTDQGENGN